jgi:hypothetical protein
MQKSLFILTSLLLITGTGKAASNYPEFSWDKVPVYLHFGSSTQMTDEQIEQTARMSNFICLEKAHGTKTDRDHAERIAGEDAQRIKKANPNAKVLLYWNTLIAWPFTSYNRDFAANHPEDWILRDMTTGEPLYKVDRPNFQVVQYNLLNSNVRNWWVDTVSDTVDEFGFDGVFMDAISQSKRPLWLRKGWGMDKEDDLDAAAIDLMKRTKAEMGPDKILIYNGFRANAAKEDGGAAAGTEFLPYGDGAQIEHFDGLSSRTKEDIVLYWEMADEAAKAGKIVLYKGWPDHDINWLNKDFMKMSAAEKEKIARQQLEYPLALYLIGARENSYFCYGWGYNIDDGQLVDYPEYSKKLGAPKGDAISRGWKFKREFEHAVVAVDLEKREGIIQWLEK